jgi:hypothetical protein
MVDPQSEQDSAAPIEPKNTASDRQLRSQRQRYNRTSPITGGNVDAAWKQQM